MIATNRSQPFSKVHWLSLWMLVGSDRRTGCPDRPRVGISVHLTGHGVYVLVKTFRSQVVQPNRCIRRISISIHHVHEQMRSLQNVTPLYAIDPRSREGETDNLIGR